jgi:protein-L-isoaspartate(D-aspartate) O-methyltransferase
MFNSAAIHKIMTKDFSKMRKTMVDCQIRTSGVIDPAVLYAFETVPREEFVPQALKAVAYGDEDVAIGGGRFMLEPRVHAKMLQALGLSAEHVVLDIGCGYGYSAAILSSIVSAVVALESDETFLQTATRNWEKHGLSNIIGVMGDLRGGYPRSAPYDAVIINGAVAEIDRGLLAQVRPGGKLICVLKKTGQTAAQAVVYEQHGACVPLFDAAIPYLQGFEPKEMFQF